MAGKNQHFMPRFVMRGFDSNHFSGKEFVWLYRKDGLKKEVPIKSVGAGSWFYGKAEEWDVDEEITQRESDYGLMINQLRNLTDEEIVDEPLISEFLAHMEVRTKSLRLRFESSASAFFELLLARVSQPGAMKELMECVLKKDPCKFKRLIEEELTKRGILLSSQMRAKIEPLAKEYMKSQLPLFEHAFRKHLSENTDKLLAAAQVSAEKGQLKALAKSIAPELRIQAYKRLSYKVVRSAKPLICPDFAPLLITEEGRIKTTYEKSDSIKSVLLPLSSSQMLIGGNYEPDKIVNYNEIAAGRCVEFFIGKDGSYENLIPLVGTKAEVLSQAELKKIVEENFISFTGYYDGGLSEQRENG